MGGNRGSGQLAHEVLRNGNAEGQGSPTPHIPKIDSHEIKVGTTAYQRKTKTQRDVIVTIVIDEDGSGEGTGRAGSTTVRKKAKCCAASSASCKAGHNDQCSLGRAMGSLGVWLQSSVD